MDVAQDYLGSHVLQSCLESMTAALVGNLTIVREVTPESVQKATELLVALTEQLRGHWFDLARHQGGTHVARAFLKVWISCLISGFEPKFCPTLTLTI